MRAVLLVLALQSATDAPPGTIFVPGGRTRIGIDVVELKRLLDDDPEAQNYAGALSGETPHQDVVVPAFWMMSTEVTQEQYAAYVRARGARPLKSWCEDALRRASEEFVRGEERLTEEARARNEPPPARRTFDPHAWWLENGASADWRLPEADRGRPAVFVDYDSARAYARFAGMRLPTEFEYQRAVRGDTASTYPWGNDWDDDKYAATSHLSRKGNTLPVGSFPAGRSKQGIHDLAGNAWEWTSSPYAPYPGYEIRNFEFGYGTLRRRVDAIANWNAVQRVVVGGSFRDPKLLCRATVRAGTDRSQITGTLGFRCAASSRPGRDIAEYVLGDDFDGQLRPRTDEGIVEYAPELAVCVDGWLARPSVASATWTPPEPHEVVADYAYVVFVPVRKLPVADVGGLERRSVQEDPVELGFLSTNVRLLEPALDAGTYLVSFRAHGTRRPTDSSPAESYDDVARVLGFDVEFDHVVLRDLRHVPRVALRRSVEYGNEREAVARSRDAIPTGEVRRPRERVVHLEAWIPCRTSRKGFVLVLDVRVESPTSGVAWRR